MEQQKSPEPITTGDLAVHLSYIRRDIDEIKLAQIKNNDEVKAKLDSLTNAYVTQADFAEHLKADADHETRIRTLESSMWKQIGMASVIATVIAAVFTIALKIYFK